MASDLKTRRSERRRLARSIAVALSVTFYLALVPIAVTLSGPIYQAIQCTLGDCREPGIEVRFVLPTRGSLQVQSDIRLPNGQPIGRVTSFQHSTDERFITVIGRLDSGFSNLADSDLRCEVAANFNIQMDADLVVSTCPDTHLPPPVHGDRVFVCGGVDHFARMGQEIRRFVLEHVRPGEQPSEVRLTGPCGADNEAATAALRAILE